MVRHFLITGETGSGKSVSAVMRLIESILRYPEPGEYADYRSKASIPATADRLRPSVLVIDPKHELADVVMRESHGRRVIRMVYGEPGQTLHFFEGVEPEEIDASVAVDRILHQCDAYMNDVSTSREPIWSMQAGLLIKDLVAVDMWLAQQGLGRVKALWGKTRAKLAEGYLNNMGQTLAYSRENYFKPLATLMALSGDRDSNEALAHYLDAAESLKVPGELLMRLFSYLTLNNSTRSSVVWVVNGILAELSSTDFAACVSLNPLEPPERLLSVRECLNEGHVVVYSPTGKPSSVSDSVARCLKTKFFEFSFERENKIRPFFYVVDEAQRFITAGAQDGEHNLLDRCRAFRTGVVLATQSIASLACRLQGAAGGGRNALQMILNNCANALYFRTTDIETQNNLMQRIPAAPVPNRPHVVKVRPLSSLGVGNCYALRSDGSWGIFQVKLEEKRAAVASGSPEI
jgi:hypothetical protein